MKGAGDEPLIVVIKFPGEPVLWTDVVVGRNDAGMEKKSLVGLISRKSLAAVANPATSFIP
jgi:hypothetical protein